MDFDFEDILKEFGISTEEKADEAAAPETVVSEIKTDSAEIPDAVSKQEDSFSDEAEAEEEILQPEMDEFDFFWPEPEPERTGPVKRNYDPEKYPDAVKAREKKKAREEREAAVQAARQKREAERQRREQERRKAEQIRREAEETRREEERERAEEQRRKLREKEAALEAARLEREEERAAEKRSREREKEAAKASKAAERRKALNAKDAVRNAKKREKEELKRRSFHRRRQGKIALIIFLLLIVLAAGGTVYAALKVSNSPRNFRNLSINEIEVGNMTRQETIDTLNAHGWQETMTAPLTVTTYGGVRVEVDPIAAGAAISAEEAAEAAFSYGKGPNIFRNLIHYMENLMMHGIVISENTEIKTDYVAGKATEVVDRFNEALGDAPYTVDIPGEKITVTKGQGSARLNERELYNRIVSTLESGQKELNFTSLMSEPVMPDFDAIYADLAVEPVEARFSDDGRFTIYPETIGCSFDVEGAKAAWEAAETAETIEIPLRETVPAVTAASLEATLFRDLLGTMTTKYTNSGDNRCSNVRLCAARVNDHILYPGDQFSYNEVVGRRTEEAGFLPAPAYVGVGEDSVKDEIGGGACQVSSTLYCASIFAFLETVERTAHVYPVNYIQLGTDATVTIPNDGGRIMDLKLRNNKSYPIKIVAYTEETDELKSVTVELWGTLEDSDYMPVEFDNTASYTWDLIYDRVVDQPAHPGREGYKIKIETERYSFEDEMGPGRRTLTHREVYNSAGEKVLDEILNPTISTGYAMDTYYYHLT